MTNDIRTGFALVSREVGFGTYALKRHIENIPQSDSVDDHNHTNMNTKNIDIDSPFI